MSRGEIPDISDIMNKLNLSIDSPLSDIIEPTFWNNRTSEAALPLTDTLLQQALARIRTGTTACFFSEYADKHSPARLQLPPTVLKRLSSPPILLYTEADGLVATETNTQ